MTHYYMDRDKVPEPPEHVTLRDQFAMAALQGLLASGEFRLGAIR